MNFNELFNDYASKNLTQEELNERADNLAKALVTNTQSYGLTPTAVSYTGFEKQAGLRPSSDVAVKDLEGLNSQLKRNSLDPLVRNPKLSFREVKGAFEQRFSAGSYFNKEVEEFKNEVRKILKEKPAEYDEIAKKKFDEKPAVFDDTIPKKIINKVIEDVSERVIPEFTIEYDEGEVKHIISFKEKVEQITNGNVIVSPRKANQLEKNSLTVKMKKVILDLLTQKLSGTTLEHLIKTFESKKDWASLIMSALDNCKNILDSNIGDIISSLDSIVKEAATKKNDLVISSGEKKLGIEIKGPTSSGRMQFKLLEFLILSPHNRTKKDLQDFLSKRGVSLSKYDQLVNNFYNNFISNLVGSKPRSLDLSNPIYVYPSDGGDIIFEVSSVKISCVGRASKYIQVSVVNKKSTSIKKLLIGKKLI